ncbi:hypothetical protein F5J12DRAFT_841291 [Pisolithus orientalis]|uniref:uncharacterized protein n=1 Tax=Pisolithus orientalis TaxID=936130 RepID=UPI002223FD27|nr:uncharacterized protein F5J12DRAFT_841291 [Pisolithus orientalis]KAI6002476.1 hypothetical protein F5J12DRAFT_841291 [Pisolithus orientalis]
MVLIDEKTVPPPPYDASPSSGPPPFPMGRASRQSLGRLPPNVLLQIIYMTFPHTPNSERQRKTLYWLAYHLRLVNHAFYIACMHILRSTYLPAYSSLVRPPYSSDPFPMSSATTSSAPLDTVQRETRVLDIFIAIKTKEDLFTDASELHLGRDELFKDLFDLMQPRSRLEDLVRHYGMREGVVHVTSTSAIGSSSNTSLNSMSNGSRRSQQNRTSIPFSALSVAFSPRKVGLTLTSSGRKRTILEVPRVPNEKLEAVAKKLVKQLKAWLSSSW